VIKKAGKKILLSVLLFSIAFAITFFAIQRRSEQKEDPSSNYKSVGEVPGLTKGETVDLPELVSLSGEPAMLKNSKKGYILCGVISTTCSRCTIDVELWKALNAEAAKKNVAFYLISPDDDQDGMKRFATAHGFENLPILIDPRRQIGLTFKIHLVPQYILLTTDGLVVERWPGLSYYDPNNPKSAQKLARFFKPISDQQN
jgi:peroxiredoxin